MVLFAGDAAVRMQSLRLWTTEEKRQREKSLRRDLPANKRGITTQEGSADSFLELKHSATAVLRSDGWLTKGKQTKITVRCPPKITGEYSSMFLFCLSLKKRKERICIFDLFSFPLVKKKKRMKGQRKVPFTNVHRLTLDNDFLTFMNVSFKCLTYHYLLKVCFLFILFQS